MSTQADTGTEVKTQETPPVETPSKNETLLAGKFKTAEELEKGYKELEKKLGERKPEIPAPQIKSETPPADEPADVPTMLSKAGLNQSDLEKQWLESGDLTNEQYEAIRKARPSMTKADIRLVAEGMAARAALRSQSLTKAVDDAAQSVGGRDALDSLLKQAADFVPPEDRDEMNRRLSDPRTVASAVRQLKYMHAEALEAGKSKPLVNNGERSSSVATIKTREEYESVKRRAMAGDRGAIEAIKNLNPNLIA